MIILKGYIDSVPGSGSYFRFDEIAYESSLNAGFDTNTESIVRLKTSECVVEVDSENDNSLYVYLDLYLEKDIPANSLLLFEIFGVKNPPTAQGLTKN